MPLLISPPFLESFFLFFCAELMLVEEIFVVHEFFLTARDGVLLNLHPLEVPVLLEVIVLVDRAGLGSCSATTPKIVIA